MTPAGVLLDANATSLTGIKCGLKDVAGKLDPPRCRTRIQVEVAGSCELWATFIDQNRFENALLNLCINELVCCA
jgi:hypothetical protein